MVVMVVTLFVVLSLTVSLILILKRSGYTSCCLVHSRSGQKNKESSSHLIKNREGEGMVKNILLSFWFWLGWNVGLDWSQNCCEKNLNFEVRRVPLLQSHWGRLGGEWSQARAGVSLLPLLPLLQLLCPHQGLPPRPRHPGADHHQHGGQQGDDHRHQHHLLSPALDQARVEGGSAPVRTGQNQGDLPQSLTLSISLSWYYHLQRLVILLHGVISKDDIEDRELWNYIVNRNYIDTNDSNFWVKLR